MAPKRPFARYEHRSEPLLTPRRFVRRFLGHAIIAGAVIAASLGIGIVGYHVTEGFSWIDSFLNASMILTGMGPASALHSTAGKIFASCYALFSGIVFLVSAGILVAPFAHRVLHRLHLTADAADSDASRPDR